MNEQQLQRAGAAVRDRIREMRATQAQIAEAAGVNPRTIRDLIAGRRWPTNHVQRRIEAVLRWRDGELVARAVGRCSLDAYSETELLRELLRRMEDRDRKDARLRGTGYEIAEKRQSPVRS